MTEKTVQAIVGFASNFHTKTFSSHAPDKKNYTSSPLGAWILLTHFASQPNIPSELRENVERILGVSIDEAQKFCLSIFEDVKDTVSLAAAAWFRQGSLTETGEKWAADLEANNVSVSPEIPKQDAIDKWVSDASYGIIKEFPIEINSEVVAILANVLATKISWNKPFQVASNDTLSFWDVKKVLYGTSRDFDISGVIVDGERYFATHSRGGDLVVSSVIAVDSTLPAERVLSAALKINSHSDDVRYLTYSEVEDSAVSIVRTVKSTKDYATVFMPSWEAEASHNLLDVFGETLTNSLAERLILVSANEDLEVKAIQTVKSSFTVEGFEAAAVSAVGMIARAVSITSDVKRLDVSYSHPYAVVASVSDETPWNGVPLFTAWVSTATSASE